MNIALGSQVPLENGPVHRLSKGSHNQGYVWQEPKRLAVLGQLQGTKALPDQKL